MIGAEGEQLGVMATKDALRVAEEDGLDLVEISPDARPPVCRIVDYGKYRYDASKSAKKAKKKQPGNQLKEMRYRPKIDEHDIRFKTERLRQFLIDGHKVRAYVEFRGREMTHTEFGYRILERIKEQLADVGQPEPNIRMEGRHMSLIINPKRDVNKQPKQPKQPKQRPQEPNSKKSKGSLDSPAGQEKGPDSQAPPAPAPVTAVAEGPPAASTGESPST